MTDEEEAGVYSFVMPDGSDRQGSEGYTGDAISSYENGDKFEGSFIDGFRVGPGTYTSAKGFVFKGSYTDNLRHGLGTLTFSTGAYYHGNYSAGKRDGHGIYRYPNGDVFVGRWANNKKHGEGIYIFAESQSRLTGQWHKGHLVSGSTWELSGGQQYTGEFSINKPCGQGTWTLSTGDTLQGTYSIKAAPVDFAPDSKESPPTLVTSSWSQ
jgi:radial spoke head protein 1